MWVTRSHEGWDYGSVHRWIFDLGYFEEDTRFRGGVLEDDISGYGAAFPTGLARYDDV
jgi:hypothetical protein